MIVNVSFMGRNLFLKVQSRWRKRQHQIAYEKAFLSWLDMQRKLKEERKRVREEKR